MPGRLVFTLLLFISLIFFGLFGCGSVDHSIPVKPIAQLPKFLLNAVTNGSLSATLKVHAPSGALEYQENLQVNQLTGEVFSSQFRLKRGFVYTFLVEFFFSSNFHFEVPISFVAKSSEVFEQFQVLEWVESDIVYSNNQFPEELMNGLSITSLPDLDADDDGYSNFYEILEGSDPFDSNSLPNPPELKIVNIPDGQVDLINVTLIFEDASGIAEIEPLNPICGYSLWEVRALDEDGRRKELKAVFKTHTHSSDETISLQFSVKDILGLEQTFTFGVSFSETDTDDPVKLGPEIAILSPKKSETVSGEIQSEAIACDEGEIQSLKPLNGDLGDRDSRNEYYFGKIDSLALGDGEKNISFVARNSEGRSVVRAIPVFVDNENPIKIDTPSPGSEISGLFTFSAHVDKSKMPNVSDLFIESIVSDRYQGGMDPDFFALRIDGNPLPESYSQSIDTTLFEINERVFTITLRAIDVHGTTAIRTVTYKIENLPDGTVLSTGFQNPSSAQVQVGSGNDGWANFNNVLFDDGVEASTITIGFHSPSYDLVVNDFGFDLPSDAIIRGVEVLVKKRGVNDVSGQVISVIDSAVRLHIDGNTSVGGSSQNRADTTNPWHLSHQYKKYGSSTDLWGLVLIPSIINDNQNFLISISAVANGLGVPTGYVDNIKANVYYELP